MRRTPYYPLGGGLDLATPIIQMPDGKLIAGDNFEPWINGGYRRMRGYERYDGRPRPSDAVAWWLVVDDNSSLALGDTVTGDSSSATGVVVALEGTTNVVITKVVGTFTAPEDANTASFNIAEANEADAPTAQLELDWRLAAENEYRGDITTVPGDGDVLGAWQIRDRVYAIRNNAINTAAVIHKASTSGWDDSLMDVCHTVRFDTGTVAFEVGDAVTGASSGATGTVHKVILHAGSYGGGDARGYIAMTSVTGTFTNGENLQVSAATRAQAADDSEQFTLPPNGRYDFVSTNFLASADTYRCYAAGGEGPAFEIDENDVVTPILLDLTLGDSPSENNPFLVEEFDGALWLMFPGGSLQRSITGDPLTYNGFLGAAEFGLGEEGTGLVNSAGRVLLAYTRRQSFGFFPTGPGTYERRLTSDRAGAILYSVEQVDGPIAVDDSGIIDARRAEVFGDFAAATISGPVQPIIFANRERIAGAMLVKESNQYRLMYENGLGVFCRQNPAAQTWEFGTFNLGLVNSTVNGVYTCEDEKTVPQYYFCGSDGFVYTMERGRNFDGEEIESFVRLPFSHQGTPTGLKRYRLAEVEVKAAERFVEMLMSADRDFSDQDRGTNSWEDTIWGGGGFYDLNDWEDVYWDARTFDTARFELRGSGENISILIYHKAATTEPFILQGVILHYDDRRVKR